MSRLKMMSALLLTYCCMSLVARDRDIIFEFKGAYFLPTNDRFKDIYKGNALYGPELTVQLRPDSCWYGFASVDYFQAKGRSLGLCDRTKVSLVPIAFGVKYFMPFSCKRFDMYAGLGFQPVRVRTQDCSEFVVFEQSRWALGGIAKVGTYVYLPCNFVLDFFVDYSFAKTGCRDCRLNNVAPLKANVSGVIFGGGLGYLF